MKVTNLLFLLTQYHPQITHKSHENKGHHCQLKEALNCLTNSLCQHLGKCIENSKENMHTDVRM